MEITTIKLQKKTKSRLDKFRIYKRETYEEILQKILELLNTCRIHPEKAKAKLIEIEHIQEQTKKTAKESNKL